MNEFTNLRFHTIFTILFILAATSWSKRIIVPENFSTIKRALGESDEGDTVFVKNGIYKENFSLVDNVTILGENKEKTIIKGDRKNPVIIGTDGAILKNFTVTNGSIGILCRFSTPVISDNIIEHNRNAGIHAIFYLPVISENKIQKNGKFGVFLHCVKGLKTAIYNNTFDGNGHSGIYCNNNTDVIIARNTFSHNKHYGVFARNSRNTQLIDNTFIQNKFPFNQLVIVDNKNRIVKSLEESADTINTNDTLSSDFNIDKECHALNVNEMNIPKDRDCLSTCFYRRFSEKLYQDAMWDGGFIYSDGIHSYKGVAYWDAAVFLGKSIYFGLNNPLNTRGLYIMANAFINLGLLQSAKNVLNFGIAKYPASSVVQLYNLVLLEIAFVEESPEEFDHYYTLMQNSCLAEVVQKECNRIKKLYEESEKSIKDTLIQQSTMSDNPTIELAEFDSLLFTKMISRPNPANIELLKNYKIQYDNQHQAIAKQLYSSKIAKLNFELEFLSLMMRYF
jgi:parallel beta-helix repeat protein